MTQKDIVPSSPKRTSLNLDEFILVEPQEAGETPNEYCLQDESRPRQFIPIRTFWSKLVPIGKAVTTLASSIGPSLNRATIVPCKESNESCRRCECTKSCHCRNSSKKPVLRKGVALSSFDEEDGPCVLQPIKLNSRDDSVEEYCMLKIRPGNSDEQGRLSVPTAGIPVDTDPRMCQTCVAEEDVSTRLSSLNNVQCDSGFIEQNSQAALNCSLLSEKATGGQPSSSSIRQEFTGEESVDSAYLSCSGVGNTSDFQVESPESSVSRLVYHRSTGCSADDVELECPVHGAERIEEKIATDERSVARTDNPVSDTPSDGRCCEETCEGFCLTGSLTGDVRLFVDTNPDHNCPLEAPNFLMKKRHDLHKASSMPTASDIISSKRLLEIEDDLLKTHRKRSASQPCCRQQLRCCTCETNGKSVTGKDFTEEEIKAIVREHCHEFVRYINWQSLLPFLESQNLLDPDSTYHLSHAHKSNQEKGNLFLLEVLPSKGHDAYRRFYSCIAQEKEHSGHSSLLKFF